MIVISSLLYILTLGACSLAAKPNINIQVIEPRSHNNFLSGGISLKDVYEGLVQRISLENWLDPLRTGDPSPFHRRDLFARPTIPELRLGWLNQGGVRLVNCMNPQQTGFPSLSIEELKAVCGGPYLVNLAPSYLTSMRASIARNLPYVNLQAWHASHSQPNNHLPGWVFDQMLPPRNWGGQWPGSNSPNSQLWQPVRIIALPKITSRYKSNCEHTVLIAYVPVQLPLQHPAVGMCTPNLQRIKMWICGPR